MATLAFWLVLMSTITFVFGQDCSVNIPDTEKRDCYPWPDVSSQNCRSRGCAYCSSVPQGVPHCYTDDTVCPSTVPETSRVDCHPEQGASKEECNRRGCIWCTTNTPGIPFCFQDSSVSQGGEYCPSFPESERVDCFPTEGASKELCIQRGCYWCQSSIPNTPWCFVPRTQGYSITSGPTSTPKGQRLELTRKNSPTWYGGDINNLRVETEYHSNQRLRIKIFDPNNARYEVPLTINSPGSQAPNPLYSVEFSNDGTFWFKVRRRSTNQVLFDSSIAGLVFADQSIHIAGKLASSNLYGFGETEHHQYKHDMSGYKHYGQFARDQPLAEGNLYGVHPFFMNLDSSNNHAFGCLILNSNAQEVSTIPAPGVVFRTIGGILDMYFFLGPTPENVIEQYTEAIGRPYMPPYWALGFHLSRYGYDNIQTLRAAVDRMRQYDIPHDVQHQDIDMFRQNLDFTVDDVNFAGLAQYVDQLKQQGTRWITILDPCISIGEPQGSYPPYDRGMAADVWLKEADGVTNAVGKVWPDPNVYFPDYSKPTCQSWWIDEIDRYHDVIKFDGIWIDMNEPANFVKGSVSGCQTNRWNNPNYKPQSIWGDVLADKTVCMDYRQTLGRHYDVHNLYGWSEAEPSLRAARQATNTRSIVISRSTFPGAGRYAVHWLGDNHSNWPNMHYSIIGTLEFNLFGMPFVGPDICGYNSDTTEEMCERWMELGAFYPFSRNHNGKGHADQDPGRWPVVASSSRKALHIRYTILPYIYTLFHEAHTRGGTVARPLVHEFTSDANTHSIDRQFLLGPAFLITPVLTQGATTVRGYFPDARWYSWHTGIEVARGTFITVNAPRDFIPLHVRGGYILPTQRPANSTMFSRSLPMGLLVAYDDNNAATGSLFWDEGDTADTYENGQYFLGTYTVTQGSLVGSVSMNGYAPTGNLRFENVTVYGESRSISTVTVNGAAHSAFSYSTSAKTLHVTDLNLVVNTAFTILWS